MRFQATDDFAVMKLKIAIKRLKIPPSIPYTIINAYGDTVMVATLRVYHTPG
jgi:hypothetical protein